MSTKKKHNQDNKRKLQTQQPQKRPTLARQAPWLLPLVHHALAVWRRFWPIFSAGAIVLAYVATVTLWPHVSVADEETSSAQPLGAIFTITDASPLSIRDISVRCYIKTMTFENQRSISDIATMGNANQQSLGAYQSSDVLPCKVGAADGVLIAADFFMVTCYKPAFPWWTIADVTRFTTSSIGGQLHWLRNAPAGDTVPSDLGQRVCAGNRVSTLEIGPRGSINFPALPAHKTGQLPKK